MPATLALVHQALVTDGEPPPTVTATATTAGRDARQSAATRQRTRLQQRLLNRHSGPQGGSPLAN